VCPGHLNAVGALSMSVDVGMQCSVAALML